MLDNKRIKHFSYILLTIFLGVSTIITTKIYMGNPILNYIRYIVIAGVFAYVLINVNITKISKKGIPLYVIWVLFASSTIISSLYNGENIIGSLWYLIGVPVVFFIAFPKYFTFEPLRVVTIALFAGHVPYLLISLVTSELRYPYEGVFVNPNQMGVLGAILGCGALTILNSQIKSRKRMRTIIPFSALVIISLLVVFMSGSRTSLITYGILIFIFMLVNLNILSRYNIKVTTVISLTAAIVVYFAYSRYGNVFDGMLSKIQYYRNQSDFASGRIYIWRTTIEDMSLLGHGSDYFVTNFGLGSHNSLIGILGEYGFISSIFMMLFAAAALILALRYYNRYKKIDSYAIAPLMIMLTFWGLSMGEGLFGLLGRGITVSYYTITGITLHQWIQGNKAYL